MGNDGQEPLQFNEFPQKVNWTNHIIHVGWHLRNSFPASLHMRWCKVCTAHAAESKYSASVSLSRRLHVRCGEVKSCPCQWRTRLENIELRCATEVGDLESQTAHFCGKLVLNYETTPFQAKSFTYQCGRRGKVDPRSSLVQRTSISLLAGKCILYFGPSVFSYSHTRPGRRAEWGQMIWCHVPGFSAATSKHFL